MREEKALRIPQNWLKTSAKESAYSTPAMLESAVNAHTTAIGTETAPQLR